MSRTSLALFLAVMGTGVFAASAAACLNDRESAKSEREFKSHYGDPPPAPAPTESSPTGSPERLFVYGWTGLGAALLVSGLVVTVLPRRRRT